MDETLITTSEPQVIESTVDTNVVNNAQTQDVNDGSQVIESATPMDSNITYNNIPDTTPNFDLNKDYTQNVIEKSIQLSHDVNQDVNAGRSLSQFLNQDYSYDKSEAGTYWVAGAINDVDTQMSFLNALIREEMYDEMDLQKYYYDTTMATARAYAAQKEKETAYGYYRAAQEKAIAEAQLTGWYMPAEGNYMLGQYTVAQNKLEDPDTTDEEKAKAQRITNTVEEWFAANQITTRGIKCLNMMNYEENVRHNTIMGELQHEANQIAGKSAGASAASAALQLRDLKFKVEEMELQTGHNFTKDMGWDNDDFLGHHSEEYGYKLGNLQGFKGDREIYVPKFDDKGKQIKDANGKVVKEKVTVSALAAMLHDSPYYYSAVLGATNSDYVNKVLEDNGIDSKTMFTQYKNDQTISSIKAFLNSEEGRGKNYLTENSGAFDKTGKTINGHEIETTVVDNKVVAGYFENGVWVPLTKKDQNKLLDSDGKTTIKDYLTKLSGEHNVDWSGTNAIKIDNEVYGFGRQSFQNTITSQKNLDALGYKKMTLDNLYNSDVITDKMNSIIEKSQTPEGYKDKDGNKVRNLKLLPDHYEKKNIDQYIILQGEDDKGKPTYYAVERKGFGKDITGKLVKKDKADIKQVGTVKEDLKVGQKLSFDGGEIFEEDSAKIAKASYQVTYNKDEDTSVMALIRSDGTVEYYTVEGNPADHSNAEYKKHGTTYKVLAKNITDQEVRDLGGTPLENKVSSDSVKESKYNASPDKKQYEETGVSGGGGGGADTSSGYEAQDTVTSRYGLFEKYNIDPLEQFNYKDITDLDKLEEALETRNNINNLTQTNTTYKTKKGGKK